MLTIDGLVAAGAPPIVAILRGLKPAEAVVMAGALVESGIRLIEVPLNSPEPFDSIAAMQKNFGDDALVGAGTVREIGEVERVADIGARLIVTPHVDPVLISHAVAQGLEVMPGFMTVSEAFAAIRAGARKLKLFPASALGYDYLKAILDVVPRDVRVWAVGGTGPANIDGWLKLGAAGLGVGGALYRPGDDVDLVRRRAVELVTAWHGIR